MPAARLDDEVAGGFVDEFGSGLEAPGIVRDGFDVDLSGDAVGPADLPGEEEAGRPAQGTALVTRRLRP
jgi:hypothetical protein